jgi:c-di-GMP-binding flagellar brake protein YcgR
MEISRQTRYPLHGRAQVALPDHRVLAARTLDISEGGVCIITEETISVGATYPLRFEISVNGKVHVIMASGKAVYGVFASQGGFRVGFQFMESDPDRKQLIKSLGAKRPAAQADVNLTGATP